MPAMTEDKLRFAADVEMRIFSRDARSGAADQTKGSDHSDASGGNERKKARPGAIGRAQAEPIRFDRRVEGEQQPKAADNGFPFHGPRIASGAVRKFP